MPDWELGLTATVRHHERASFHHILLDQEKIKIPSMVSTECILSSHHCKVENTKSNHQSSETVCMQRDLLYGVGSHDYVPCGLTDKPEGLQRESGS